MNRFAVIVALLAMAAITTSAGAQSDPTSLGDYARRSRADNPPKRAVRVYDNDDLSSKSTLAATTNDPPASTDAVPPGNNVPPDQGSNTGANAEDGEIKVGQSVAERQKAYAVWRDRISTEREHVDQLARELDDLRTNAPKSVSVLHIWPDDAKYKIMLEEKQKGLDQARADLDDLLEQARKAGVPSSFR